MVDPEVQSFIYTPFLNRRPPGRASGRASGGGLGLRDVFIRNHIVRDPGRPKVLTLISPPPFLIATEGASSRDLAKSIELSIEHRPLGVNH